MINLKPISFLFFFLTASAFASVTVCEEAPDFSLRDMSGEMTSLKKIVENNPYPLTLISFFQTTCVPCIQEIQQILALKDEKKFEFVLVGSKETREPVQKFLEKFSFDVKTVLTDPNGKLDKNYKISSIPILIVLNKQGVVLSDMRGQSLSAVREKMGFKDFIENQMVPDKCK